MRRKINILFILAVIFFSATLSVVFIFLLRSVAFITTFRALFLSLFIHLDGNMAFVWLCYIFYIFFFILIRSDVDVDVFALRVCACVFVCPLHTLYQSVSKQSAPETFMKRLSGFRNK